MKNTQEKLPFIILIFVLLINLSLVLYIQNSWKDSINRFFPLKSDLSLLRNDISEAHLWLEEIIGGDKFVDSKRDILEKLENKKIHELIILIDDDNLDTQLSKINQSLKSLKKIVIKRLVNFDINGTGSALDQEFDKEFISTLSLIDKTIAYLDLITNKELDQKNRIIVYILVIFLLINIFFLYLFYNSNKIQNKQNKDLEYEKNKLDVIIRNIPDLLWIKDKDGVYLGCNQRFEEFFGQKEKDILGKTDYDFVDKNLADSFRKHDNNAMYSEIPLSNYETLAFASDGHEEYVKTTKTKITLEDGLVYGILGLAKDLTEDMKIEKQLLNTQRIGRFGSYSYDFIKDNWQSSNELNEIFGIDENHEKTYSSWIKLVHEDYRNEMIKYFETNILKNKEEFDKIYKVVNQTTKKELWVHGRGELSYNKNGEPIELYGMIQDITYQKSLRDNLEKQKEEFETIFNYSHDSIVIIDLDTNFLNFNESFIHLTGYSKEELLTMNCNELTAPEFREKNKKILEEAIEKGHVGNYEKDCIVKDNIRLSVNESITLLPDKKRLLVNLKDVTILKNMKEQSKLAAMGEMIGNIAHQWRQPLSIITTSASGLKVQSEIDNLKNDDISKSTDLIMQQANYLSNTIENFRNFLKTDKLLDNVSIKDAIESALSLINASLCNHYIKLILNIDYDIYIKGNKNELIESLINILNNSKDAIKSKNKKEENKYIFITTKRLDNGSLELTICDSGGGIEENIMDRLFEPYFTTKHQSQGTGLGLSISEKILRERYNTSIKVYNKEFVYDKQEIIGACFSIIFNR